MKPEEKRGGRNWERMCKRGWKGELKSRRERRRKRGAIADVTLIRLQKNREMN